MARLPDEVWLQILEYLDPSDLLHVQRVSSQLLKIARDTSLWRAKCFEKAPSAAHAFSRTTDSLTDLLNGLSLARQTTTAQSLDENRRTRAITRWDCTNRSENIDWYSEYIARHAELSAEWLRHTEGNEIRSMAMFGEDDGRVLSAMEDGSLRIWDVKTATSGRRSLHETARSASRLLSSDLSVDSGPSSSPKQPNIGTAIDSTLVDLSHTKAYVAVEDVLNELDLTTMSLVSQNKYAWRITAISQQADNERPLMVGTSYSLHVHDPRARLQHQSDQTSDRLDNAVESSSTVFLPNYSKSKQWPGPSGILGCPSRRSGRGVIQPESYRTNLEAWAPVEPGPQTILHRGLNEIIVAGRMPSILFYDKRVFPQLHYVIHSGARLSSVTTLPYAPCGMPATNVTAEATLIAAGEYHGRGSLELYELPHNRASDGEPSYENSEDGRTKINVPQQSSPHQAADDPHNIESATAEDADTPYAYRNRQTSSAAKLLSVATQGARIVFSDSEGSLKWVERDGRGLARKWNINSYQYTHSGGAVVGDSVARKILTFPSDAETRTSGSSSRNMTRGDGDLLVWTGSDLGIITSKVKWTGHDELVKAFEEQLSLDDSPEGPARRSAARRKEQEEEYARTMRRALERQADERRFLARFGRVRP